MRIDQLRQEFELDCQYHPFPLHPETPEEGMRLDTLFGGRVDIPAAMQQMGKVADSLDLPFGERTHTYNSRKAQELGLWATKLGKFRDFENAVYRAYFVDGTNIGDTADLLWVVGTLGLNVPEAEMMLKNHCFSDRVDAEWDHAVSSGVRAVPTLRCEERELVGFQSLDACRRLISG